MKYLNWENNYICQRLNCSTSIEIKSNDSLSNKGGRRKVKNNQDVGNMGKKNGKVIFLYCLLISLLILREFKRICFVLFPSKSSGLMNLGGKRN